jgi:hypothetical protein
MPFSERASFHDWGVFYEDSEILTNQATVENYQDWEAGQRLESRLEPIGLIRPTDEEVAILNDTAFNDDRYMRLDKIEAHPLVVAMRGFINKFYAAVDHDMLRGGLSGSAFEHIDAGFYDRPQIPHIDDMRSPAIKWMAAFGVGSTVAYNGKITLDEIEGIVPLQTDVPIHGVDDCEEVHFPEGTITRIRSSDIHSWPSGSGRRFYVQTTLFVDQ